MLTVRGARFSLYLFTKESKQHAEKPQFGIRNSA